MTEEQIQMLIGAADGKFRPILWTFLLTGMQTGELLDLEWEAVDFEREEVHIRSKTGWRPKDREDRTIPLHSRS